MDKQYLTNQAEYYRIRAERETGILSERLSKIADRYKNELEA